MPRSSVTCFIVMTTSPSIAVGATANGDDLDPISGMRSAAVELEEAEEVLAVPALHQVLALVGGGRQRPQLVGVDEPLAVGGGLRARR